MSDRPHPQGELSASYKNAPTRTVTAGGVEFAYRELGPKAGTPVIFLTHLAANLDNWDPRVVDGIAAKHRVITFDNRGVGASTGRVPDTVEAMAHDAVTFVRALGFEQVDILGFSLGGMIAQVIALEEPQLIRKLILTGTGPAGGEGIDKVTPITIRAMLKGALTFKDPKTYLFFTRTATGRTAARAFMKRLNSPARILVSSWFTPAAWISTNTSLSRTSGLGISPARTTSGPP